jgi:hypothetical protein
MKILTAVLLTAILCAGVRAATVAQLAPQIFTLMPGYKAIPPRAPAGFSYPANQIWNVGPQQITVDANGVAGTFCICTIQLESLTAPGTTRTVSIKCENYGAATESAAWVIAPTPVASAARVAAPPPTQTEIDAAKAILARVTEAAGK